MGEQEVSSPSPLQGRRPSTDLRARPLLLSGTLAVFFLSGSCSFDSPVPGFYTVYLLFPHHRRIVPFFSVQHEQQWQASWTGNRECMMKLGFEGTEAGSEEDVLQGPGGRAAVPRLGARGTRKAAAGGKGLEWRGPRVERALGADFMQPAWVCLEPEVTLGLACTLWESGGHRLEPSPQLFLFFLQNPGF